MSQKIVLFIGADNTGKTEIAKALSEKTNISYFKYKQEKLVFTDNLNLLYYVAPVLYDVCKQTNCSLIFDRCYICEYSYSKALNRTTDFEYIKNLDKKYSELNTYIIYCYKTHYNEYEDEFIDFDKIDSINKYYHEFLSTTENKYLYLDTTDENLEKQIEQCEKFLNEDHN